MIHLLLLTSKINLTCSVVSITISPIAFMVLNDQLEKPTLLMCDLDQFSELKGIGDLAKKKKNKQTK